jgi:hypothetical protein
MSQPLVHVVPILVLLLFIGHGVFGVPQSGFEVLYWSWTLLTEVFIIGTCVEFLIRYLTLRLSSVSEILNKIMKSATACKIKNIYEDWLKRKPRAII